jgi:hypothetical protein
VDEQHTRTLLAELADTPAPASAVDVAAAVRRGSRTVATRRAVLAAAAAAGVSTVTGAVFAVASRTGRRASLPPLARVSPPPSVVADPDPPGQPALARAPQRFDWGTEWAAFGWLPSGLTDVSSVVQDERVELVARRTSPYYEPPDVLLVLLPAGQSPAGDPRSLARSASEPAAPVGGQPAEWGLAGGRRVELRWRYAPDAWATLSGASLDDTGLHRVARTLRLSDSRRLRFPFQVTGLSKELRPVLTDVSTSADGRYVVGVWLDVATAKTNRQQRELAIEVTHIGWQSPGESPAPPNSTVDGQPVRRVTGNGRDLLTAELAGQLKVRVDAVGGAIIQRLPVGGVAGVYRKLRVLPDPAEWTDQPLV